MHTETQTKGKSIYQTKIDFKTKSITIDKVHYIVLKGSIQQEDTTLVNIYESNIRTLKYIKKLLMDIKEEVNSNEVIVRDFNTPLILMDRSSRQKKKSTRQQ